jgi:AcrR family transcriptional regulator
MATKTRREEHTESTRQAVFEAARELFTERGYAQTSTEEIVRRARVTRGSLYYHFTDKRDLFRAVADDLNTKLTAAIAERALKQSDVWSGVVRGTEAFLDACLDPSYQRIILLDGPAVLGWEEWRALAERHGLGIIRAALEEAMRQGVIDQQPVEPLAHLFHGALHEAAVHIARADDLPAARRDAGAALIRLMEGLRTPAVKPKPRHPR